ncbi:MAG: EamA-like transporter family protein [Microgenomates bacterium OLB23]|nr:MAG: EamA-like transporter family protein [Microgenomates bacterium OLB23]
MNKVSTGLNGALALFGAAFIYSTFGILIRQLATMFGDGAQSAARFLLALVFITLFMSIKKEKAVLPKKAVIRASLLGITFGVVLLLFTISVNTTKIANSVFLLYAGSIISSLIIGTFIFKEKLTAIKIIAIVIALFGLLMYSNALLSVSIGVVTGFASGIFDGISNSLRKSLKGFSRNKLLQYQFAIGGAFLLLTTLITGEQIIKEVSLLPILVLIVFALLQVGLGNLLLYGFQHFDVNIGTVILSMELFFASIMGFLLFREVPTSKELLGGLLIFVASVLSAVDFKELFSKIKTS